MKLIPKPFKKDDELEEFIQSQAGRIVAACARDGYEVSIHHAIEMWQAYSEDMSAGWMLLPLTDKGIVRIILNYAEVVEA